MKTLEYIPAEEVDRTMYRPLLKTETMEIADVYTFEDGEEENESIVQYWVRIVPTELGPGKGYIYILENAGQPGILKIGFTTRTPQDRVKEINSSTGVIIPWYIRNAFQCKSPDAMEKLIHERLKRYKVHKEGFGIRLEEAEKVILQVLEEQSSKI